MAGLRLLALGERVYGEPGALTADSPTPRTASVTATYRTALSTWAMIANSRGCSRHRNPRIALPAVSLRGRSHPCYLIPDLESSPAFGTVFSHLEPMPPRTEVLADGTEG